MRAFTQAPSQKTSAKSEALRRSQVGPTRAASPIQKLQSRMGNQALQRMLRAHAETSKKDAEASERAFGPTPVRSSAPAAIQPKLTVNTPGDAYEQESDRVAEQVMRMPEPGHSPESGHSTRTGGQSGGEQVRKKPLAANASTGAAAPRIVHEALRSPGQPLDTATRAFMEPRFGRDLSHVRVHTDSKSDEAAAAIGARAFTLGQRIAFAHGQYTPGTEAGTRLMAHELAHVVQQGAGHAILQRSPDDKGEGSGDLKLPWKHGDYSLFEEKSSGIRFLMAGESGKEDTYRAPISDIAKQIAADNARIKDTAFEVLTCIVAPTTTRFALLYGKPTLMLEPKDENVETAAHEMGHAIFYYLEKRAETKEKDAPTAANFRSRIADIYLRLSQTKEFASKEGASLPAGLWIADPSQWKPGSAQEHPSQDADEFFASAKESYQVGREGFERAIREMVKVDPDVKSPADELLACCVIFSARESSRPEARRKSGPKPRRGS